MSNTAGLAVTAMGAVALLGMGRAGSRQATTPPTIKDLEESLRAHAASAPRGSRAPVRTKRARPAAAEPVPLFPAAGGVEPQPRQQASRPVQAPWDILLQMESSDVPDELLVALLIEEPGDGDPVERARKILAQAGGSLGRLLDGIGPLEEGGDLSRRAQARLIAAAELARRAHVRQFGAVMDHNALASPDAVRAFLRRVSQGAREILSAIYLNQSLNPIAYRVLSVGDPRMTIVNMAEVFRPAMLLRASGGIIIAHQHPSGSATPSEQDFEVFRSLRRAGELLRIPVHDSVVIGNDTFVSIREMGI